MIREGGFLADLVILEKATLDNVWQQGSVFPQCSASVIGGPLGVGLLPDPGPDLLACGP